MDEGHKRTILIAASILAARKFAEMGGKPLLAITTELNFYFKLNCDADVAFIWTIIQEFIPEGRDMFKKRYASMVGP
jgi:hypothetical protein